MAGRDEKPAGKKSRFPADGRGFLFPPVLWALFFVTAYAVQGTGCAMGWDRVELLGFDAIQVTLVAVTLVVLVMLICIGIWSWRAHRVIAREYRDDDMEEGVRQSRFLAAGAALSAGLFFVASLWIGLPVLWSQSCGGLS